MFYHGISERWFGEFHCKYPYVCPCFINKVNITVPNVADLDFHNSLVYNLAVGWPWAWWLRTHNDMTETILMSHTHK